VAYRVENFNNENLNRINALWPAIRSAIERGLNLVNSFGINRDTLTSANALIPIVYYFLQHGGVTLLGTTGFDGRNATAIQRWLLMALLNNVFGGASDNVLLQARRILKETAEGDDFPTHALNNGLTNASVDSNTIENLIGLRYGQRETYLALSLLSTNAAWGTTSFHQDHIFPRTTFDHLDNLGLDASTRGRYLELRDRLGNLELLSAQKNLDKSGQPFEQWLASRDSGFRTRHLIPDDPNLLGIEYFEEFVQVREVLIRNRLTSVLLPSIHEEMPA
jgi:hypothetical protein